jgi:hypothetical protein
MMLLLFPFNCNLQLQQNNSLSDALFRPVKNNVTKTLDKHLHPDSIYQEIVRHYGE